MLALLARCLSLYLAAAMALFARWRRGARAGATRCCSPPLWLLAELARGVIFTGFPWLASGYAHVDSPLAALAPWIGVYGIGASSPAGWRRWSAAPAAARAPRWLRAAAGALACSALGAVPAASTSPSRPARSGVTLLQSNVPQDEKFAAERLPADAGLDRRRSCATARGELVVAPETAIPLLPDSSTRATGRRCARTSRRPARRR